VPFKGLVASVSPETMPRSRPFAHSIETVCGGTGTYLDSAMPRMQLRKLLKQLPRVGRDLVSAIEKHLTFHRYFYESRQTQPFSTVAGLGTETATVLISTTRPSSRSDVAGVHEELWPSSELETTTGSAGPRPPRALRARIEVGTHCTTLTSTRRWPLRVVTFASHNFGYPGAPR